MHSRGGGSYHNNKNKKQTWKILRFFKMILNAGSESEKESKF